MKKKTRILIIVLGCLGIFLASLCITVHKESQMVISGLKIARVAINPTAVAYVHTLIENKVENIQFDKTYIELGKVLTSISN